MSAEPFPAQPSAVEPSLAGALPAGASPAVASRAEASPAEPAPAESADTAADHLLDILGGKSRAQAVSTAAALGIADRLAAGPRTAADLARDLHCEPGALQRLLQVLASLSLCEEQPGIGFALTAHGQALRSDALGPLAAFLGAPEQWDPWSRLRDALAVGGGVAFERTHGTPLYEYLAHDEPASQRYDAAIDAFTRHEARALSRHVDFGDVTTVVDVGGGRGALLRDLLARWPRLRGVLFDLPHVVERHGAELGAALGGRIDVVAGSFLEEVPAGADVYILKRVLHNWSDEAARAILARCAAALREGGAILVIDGILTPGGRADMTRLLDLEMLVLTGGRERRKPELRRLFRDSGLVLERTVRLTHASHLMVCSARRG
ncbi:MAG TPA: methyltransferase [Planctomycetota bacterium]|nr:methyltransferase [Planctomycetota bacterium]